MSVEGAQFVTFLKVERQRIQGRSGFALIMSVGVYKFNPLGRKTAFAAN
jgi:hypothetical protein